MKKINLLIIGVLCISIVISGCGKKEENNKDGESGLTQITQTPVAEDQNAEEDEQGYFDTGYNEYFIGGITYTLDQDTKTAAADGIYNLEKTSYNVPDTIEYNGTSYRVTEITESVFAYNESMTSVSLSKNLTKLPEMMFYGCSNLTAVVVPEGVTELGDGVFTYCEMLTDVSLPSTLTKIGEEAFFGCAMLQAIVIPDSVTSIGASAFFDCSLLRSIAFPSGMKTLPDEALNNCTCLETVIIPDGVTVIGFEVFWGCQALKSVVLPDSVVTVGSRLFYDCTSLEEVTLPVNLAVVDGEIFSYCDSLKTVYASETVAEMLEECDPFAEYEIVIR